MYHYYQRSEHDAWFLLSFQGEENPAELAKAQGAKKLTILALNQMVNDGTEAELPRNRDLVLVCHHGNRSQRVAMFLAQNGFDALANVSGGINAWSIQHDPAVPRY